MFFVSALFFMFVVDIFFNVWSLQMLKSGLIVCWAIQNFKILKVSKLWTAEPCKAHSYTITLNHIAIRTREYHEDPKTLKYAYIHRNSCNQEFPLFH